jgi:hypothetical protein
VQSKGENEDTRARDLSKSDFSLRGSHFGTPGMLI